MGTEPCKNTRRAESDEPYTQRRKKKKKGEKGKRDLGGTSTVKPIPIWGMHKAQVS